MIGAMLSDDINIISFNTDSILFKKKMRPADVNTIFFSIPTQPDDAPTLSSFQLPTVHF